MTNADTKADVTVNRNQLRLIGGAMRRAAAEIALLRRELSVANEKLAIVAMFERLVMGAPGGGAMCEDIAHILNAHASNLNTLVDPDFPV